MAVKERLLYTTKTDDRSRMRAVANNLILHIHPTKVAKPALRFSYTWGLGGISTILATILAITGVLLMFRYDASIDRAYTSIQAMETELLFGSLIRAMHHWSANLLIITAFLHMLRVFFSGGFKKGRSTNWIVGIVLLLIVIAFNFTGYLLPWDQLAYWAITVGTSLLDYLPLVGSAVSGFLLAGPEVGQGALRNFYAIHVAVLPALLVILMSYHFWKVRKDGGISQPLGPSAGADGKRRRVERVTTIPHLVQIELAAAAIVVTVLLLLSMLTPAPLEELANPSHAPNPAKAAWYFMGLQELLLHMHPLAAMMLPGILLAAMAAIPYWDKNEDDIGVYFRSTVGKKTAAAGALLGLVFIPLLVLFDEFWLDLPALLPNWPALISNGLIPLLLSLAALFIIYTLFRLLFRANQSEALVGLASFIITGFVLLTLVGIYFRGPNMALIWPF